MEPPESSLPSRHGIEVKTLDEPTDPRVRALCTRLHQHRAEILDDFVAELERTNNPLRNRPEEIVATVTPILDQTCGIRDLSTGDLSAIIGGQRATQGVPPEASLRAASILFGVVAEQTLQNPVGPAARLQVLRRLHDAILHRVVGAALPYASGLLRKISTAHHEERRRIARDLHDHVAHSIAICLQQLELRQIAVEKGDQADAHQRLTQLEVSLAEASDLIRQLARELGQFQTGSGFVNALHRFIELNGTDRVSVTVSDTNALETAPPWILEEFFFAVREGLQNALTHSESETIDVAVGILDDHVRVTIEDRGKGMDPSQAQGPSAGKGLVSMRERVELLGGRATVLSEPGKGTLVDLRAPLYQE